MKKILIIALLFTGFCGFAQDDVSVKGNSVTVRETAPVWPGCESDVDTKACFNKMLMKHVRENYHYPKNEKGKYIRGKAVISLEINEKGKVVVNEVKGENLKINKEARRMIEAMPTMIPGKRGGKPASIKYTIPLTL